MTQPGWTIRRIDVSVHKKVHIKRAITKEATVEMAISQTNRKDEASEIIHGFAAAHAFVALILANTVIGDAPILTILTFAMINSLGNLFGVKNTPFQILKKLLQMFAALIGGYLAAKGLTWIPWVGNIINASISFGITETIGWTIFHLYSSGKTLENASDDDINIAKSKAESDKANYDDYKDRINNLPDNVRLEYEDLIKKMATPGIPENKQQEIAKQMRDILVRHINIA